MKQESVSIEYSQPALGLAGLAIACQSLSLLGRVLAAVACLSATSLAAPKLPPPQGFVTDFAEKLSPAAKQVLEARLQDFKRQSDGIELAVVTIPYESMGGLPIEKYSLQLARGWGIGAKGKRKDGVLLLIAIKPPDEQGIYHGSSRLEVSRSLEDDLSSRVSSGIIGAMHDDFVAGRFDQAVTTGVDRVIETIGQKRGLAPTSKPTTRTVPPARNNSPPSRGILGSLIDLITAFFTGGGAMVFFAIMLAILLMLGGFRNRSSDIPGRPPYYRSSTIWKNSDDISTGTFQQSRDYPSAPDAGSSSGDMGPPGGSDLGASSSGTDSGSSGGGSDFGSSSGGGDFGGGGSTGNF